MQDIIVEDVTDGTDIQSPLSATRKQVSHLSLAPRLNIDTPTKEEEGKMAEIWFHAASVAWLILEPA